MKKCSLILCEKTISQNSQKSLSSVEIVFKPMYEFLKDSLILAGIDNTFAIFKKEERTDGLRNFVTHNEKGDVFISQGTSPFISEETVKSSYEAFLKNDRKATAIVSDFCDSFSAVWMTVDDFKKHCSFEQEEEISLDDVIGTFDNIDEFTSTNKEDFMSVNNLFEAYELNEYKRKEILKKLMLSGVQIMCTDGVAISEEAVIESGAVILSGTQITGKTEIASGAVIGPNSVIDNCKIGENAKINASHCYSSEIEKGAEIGPFVRIRPGCVVSENARVGNFVELKNVTVGKDTKISHLSYVGDGSVGSEVNIGCGCATVNFDGTNKHRTVIEDGAFIGCGVNLVAPVTVGKDAFVAAGSTVIEDVPDSALAIARNRQVNKNGWVEKKKPYKRMKKNGR